MGWLACKAALAVLIATLGLLAAASPSLAGDAGTGEPGGGNEPDPDALVLDDAGSPVLKKLKHVSGLDSVDSDETDRRRPGRFELLIVDGDSTPPGALERNGLIDRFIGAGRWVAALDIRPADQDAIATRTGFDTESEESQRSETLLFRIVNVEGTPTIEIVNSGPLAAGGRERLGKRRARKLKLSYAAQVARIVDERIDEPSEAREPRAASPEKVACPTLDPAPSPDLQHIGWCYTDVGQKAPGNGFWTQAQKRWWIDSYGDPGSQTATWTMNHRFDVFLDNDPAHPRGNFDTVTYALNGQFTPKRPLERFFRMEDVFTSGWHGERVLERAWWTGGAGVTVEPTSSNPQLILQGSHPANANSETSYTSGEEFNVGFSGTAASPQSGLGVGLQLSYTSSNSKTHSIPDWGVENRTSGNQLGWFFNARQPCDTRPNRDRADCFDRKTFFVGPHSPSRPSDLSRGLLQVNASGRWRTRAAVADDAELLFGLSTPVTLVDTYCDGEFIGGWCGTSGRIGYRTELSGAPERGVGIEAGWVNPIPIKSLRLEPDPADGSRNQKVTGKVILARKAKVPVNVRIVSNSDNANVGAPFAGAVGGSQTSLTIDPGQDTGTFTVNTNANRLAAGESTTANITAFYAESTTQPLTIQRPK